VIQFAVFHDPKKQQTTAQRCCAWNRNFLIDLELRIQRVCSWTPTPTTYSPTSHSFQLTLYCPFCSVYSIMNNDNDIERAPMLASNSPDEDEEENLRHASLSPPRFTSLRSKRSESLFSKPLLTVYGVIGTIFLIAFTLWATDRSRSWRRKSVYWNALDDNKTPASSSNLKMINSSDYVTGNRTRRFRGTNYSLIDQLRPN